ncbi:MAG: ATP-binding protein, partial [Pyrinomonadaceae bacterium]|nr:ATP-binding protein [Pyrinomonadaceae bacterium]
MPKKLSSQHGFSLVGPTDDGLEPDAGNAGDATECQKCLGTGVEIVPGKGARTCECRRSTVKANPFEKVRVPKRYLGCHINSYKPNHPSQERAVRFAMQFTQEYPAVEQGVLFMGPVGVGKTHLAVSVLKGLTERGFSCLFYEFGALLKEIQDSYNANTHTSELGVLSPVLNAEILVLDELGASKPTDWVRDTMAHIINTRYNENRFTIFTTNYLDAKANERDETLEDRIGVRLRSRLYEMCRTIEMTGPD